MYWKWWFPQLVSWLQQWWLWCCFLVAQPQSINSSCCLASTDISFKTCKLSFDVSFGYLLTSVEVLGWVQLQWFRISNNILNCDLLHFNHWCQQNVIFFVSVVTPIPHELKNWQICHISAAKYVLFQPSLLEHLVVKHLECLSICV